MIHSIWNIETLSLQSCYSCYHIHIITGQQLCPTLQFTYLDNEIAVALEMFPQLSVIFKSVGLEVMKNLENYCFDISL